MACSDTLSAKCFESCLSSKTWNRTSSPEPAWCDLEEEFGKFYWNSQDCRRNSRSDRFFTRYVLLDMHQNHLECLKFEMGDFNLLAPPEKCFLWRNVKHGLALIEWSRRSQIMWSDWTLGTCGKRYGSHFKSLILLLGNYKIRVEYAMRRVPPQSPVAVMEASCQGSWWIFPLVVLPPQRQRVCPYGVATVNSQADPRWDSDQVISSRMKWSASAPPGSARNKINTRCHRRNQGPHYLWRESGTAGLKELIGSEEGDRFGNSRWLGKISMSELGKVQRNYIMMYLILFRTLFFLTPMFAERKFLRSFLIFKNQPQVY